MKALSAHAHSFPRAAGSLILLAVLLVGAAGPATAQRLDWSIPNGWFFTQAGGGQGDGFAVTDDGTIRFWQAFREVGGVQALGYPISWRYVGEGGFIYQAFQGGVLQWQPTQRRAFLANTFETLEKAGKDPLLAAKGVPKPIADDGAGGDWEKAKAARLSWLSNEAIHSYYLSSPDPRSPGRWTESDSIQLYGLPMSKPARSGPFVVQRFQRVALQLWLDQVPGMPLPGTVVRVLGGDLLKEAGLLPADSLAPLAADSPYLRIDPVLRRPMDTLYASKRGRALAEVAQSNGVPIVIQHLPPKVIAEFRYSRSGSLAVIEVSTTWHRADPKALAALLAHEATHAADFFASLAAGEPERTCLDKEKRAYREGALFWLEAYGPRGKPRPADDLDRQLNSLIGRYEDPAFESELERLCQERGRPSSTALATRDPALRLDLTSGGPASAIGER